MSAAVAFLPQNDEVSYAAFLRREKRRRALARLARFVPEERADILLESVLDPWQYHTYTDRFWFLVEASAGGTYFIAKTAPPMIILLNDVCDLPDEELRTVDLYPVGSYCFHADAYDEWPIDDQAGTIKLWLDSDEEKFKWYANYSLRVHPSWCTTIPYEIGLARRLAKIARRTNKVLESKTATLEHRIEAQQYWVRACLRFRWAPRQ